MYGHSTVNVHDPLRPPLIPATTLVVDMEAGMIIPLADPADAPNARTARILELRNVAAVTGECPECGARLVKPNRAARRHAQNRGYALRARMAHQSWCPAGDERVPPAGIEGMRVAR